MDKLSLQDLANIIDEEGLEETLARVNHNSIIDESVSKMWLIAQTSLRQIMDLLPESSFEDELDDEELLFDDLED